MVSRPLRQTVGAHYGWKDWLVQRVSAVVMAIYTLLLLVIALWTGGLDYAVWKSVFANSAFRIASFIFMLSVFLHAWVGVRNITMDYIKPTAIRLIVQIAVICALVAYTGWTIQVLWGAR